MLEIKTNFKVKVFTTHLGNKLLMLDANPFTFYLSLNNYMMQKHIIDASKEYDLYLTEYEASYDDKTYNKVEMYIKHNGLNISVYINNKDKMGMLRPVLNKLVENGKGETN